MKFIGEFVISGHGAVHMSGVRVPGHAHMSGSPAYDDLLWAVAILPIVSMMQKPR